MMVVFFASLSNDNSEYWWKKRQFLDKFIAPTYPGFIGELNKQAETLVQYLKAQSQGNAKFEVEAYGICRQWIFEVICEATFGKESFNKNLILKEKFYDATCYWIDSFVKFVPFKYPYDNLISWSLSIGLDQKMRDIHDFLTEILQHKRQSGLGKDWMSILAQSEVDGHRLSDDDIKILCVDMIFGTVGPVPFLLDYGMYSLAKFGYVQEKVLLEHKRVVGEDRLTLTWDDIHKLPYLRGTAMEMLRVYPAGGGIGVRSCNKDTQFQGYHIPAGTTMVSNVYSIHRQERYWKEPNTVDPMRWAPDAPRNESAFLTFGAGPKACPGRDYSVLLATVVFSRLINSFDIEYQGDEPEVIFALVSKTKNPIKLTLSTRQKGL